MLVTRGLFCTDYTQLVRLVCERQIVGIYVSYVCGALLHFRIGFSVIIDVLYSDAVVARVVHRIAGRLTAIVLYRGPLPAAASTPSVVPTSRSSNFTLPGDSDTNALAAADAERRLRRQTYCRRTPFTLRRTITV